eukprot:3965986-Amphidinium_carterae.1
MSLLTVLALMMPECPSPPAIPTMCSDDDSVRPSQTPRHQRVSAFLDRLIEFTLPVPVTGCLTKIVSPNSHSASLYVSPCAA